MWLLGPGVIPIYADETPELTGGGIDLAEASVDKDDVLARLYRSPSERREAGLGRHVTEWLTVSGLVEVESEHSVQEFASERSDDSRHFTDKTIQLGLTASLTEHIATEFVLEHEVDIDHTLLDEAIVQYEGELLSMELGRLYLPFGEYYSHFVTGPILEFGETRGNALVVDIELNDYFDLITYALSGKAEKLDQSGGHLDWGGGVDFANADESVQISVGYFSDLAETEEKLLDDFRHDYRHRVDAISAHALIGGNHYEITAEYLAALRSFKELDKQENRPWAANLELAWFPTPYFQLAARAEASSDIADQPRRQYGLSAAWLISGHINISVDYLFGQFKNDFAFDDDDNEIDTRHLLAAQVSIEF